MIEGSVIYTASVASGALRQGEIISNLIQSYVTVESLSTDGKITLEKEHEFAIVVTQDCDLDWDFRARNSISPVGEQGASESRQIPNILFCEVHTAVTLRSRQGMSRQFWDRIKINKDERYQFFQAVAPEYDLLGEGLPKLGIDFKRYFTIPTDELYTRLSLDSQRRCCILSPYLEHFTTRFSHYLSRIALPSEHFSEPSQAS